MSRALTRSSGLYSARRSSIVPMIFVTKLYAGCGEEEVACCVGFEAEDVDVVTGFCAEFLAEGVSVHREVSRCDFRFWIFGCDLFDAALVQ